MISNLKFNSPNCDTYPWAADNSISCDSVCLKWQFTYTVSGETKYYTVRGCANQLLYNFPATESCQQPQYMSGGDYNAVGGGQAGESRLCFCTGDYCNPATKTAAFGSGALLLTALLVRMYL
uniref:Uncharacterized protein n=1 Tax=Plectus sambesii TaxID=2011161 RepID=A0A914X5C9_9BILA